MGISCQIGLDDGDMGPTKQGNRLSASEELGASSATLALENRGAAVRRSRADIALRLLETLLLVAGASLLVVYAAAQVDSVRGREQALAAFAEANAAATEASAPLSPTYQDAAALDQSHEPDTSLWGTGRIAAYRESSEMQHDTPLGVITMPSIRLEAPIFEGTSELALNRGIGRIEGTAELGAAGNLGLAGHRDGFFRPLKEVHLGEPIDVESLAGTTRYRVTELMIVEPTDVYVLAPTDAATLTLVTCYPFYFVGDAPQRYIVKAVAEGSTARVAP